MGQPFAAYKIAQSPVGPSPKGFAITPDNSNDLADYIRALTINSGGVVVYDNWDGVTCTTASLPAGTYAMLARRIRSTSTTATGLTGWV